MNDDALFVLGKPPFYVTATDESAFADLYLRLADSHRNAVIRMVRGKKCKTVEGFFDEIAAALQFPYYFGENWAAFEECITDLDWLEGDAYLLMIGDAPLLLSNADSEDFRILMRILADANQAWLTPNQYIPRERPPTPFHVLFQCAPSDVAAFCEKLRSAGAEFEMFRL